MANSIELITKYSTKAWDKVYKAEALSSLLDAPEAQVQFTGAKTVKIAKFSASGLGNYYRNNDGDGRVASANPFGYAGGNVGLTWEEFTLEQDRSARYPVELFDNEETDGLTLGAATTEISRTIMIPEVDAYCFSKIASYASADLGNLVDGAITKETSLTPLNDALLYFDEHEVPAEKQIIFVSPKYMNALRSNTSELSRYLLQADYSKDVKFTLTSYEGRKIAVVPPQRFRTLIDLSGYGVHWKTGSKDIDFMVVATDAVMHVVKYNKVKIISGDMNLAGANFDGYSIFARIYHDVFVPDNKRYAIYVHTGGFDAASINKFILEVANNKIAKVTTYPAEKVAKLYKTTRSALPAVGTEFVPVLKEYIDEEGETVPATETSVKVGSAVATGDKIVAVVDGRVLGTKTI